MRERRPPKMIPDTGTPPGSFQAGSSAGLFVHGAVKRLLGCAAFFPVAAAISGVQRSPVQSTHSFGASGVFPSHHTSPSGNIATLVKIVLCDIDAIAFGFVSQFVPGTTPKYPASGLIARKRPSTGSTHIHTMSSPTVVTFHPAR